MSIIFLNVVLFIVMLVFCFKEKNATYAVLSIFCLALFCFELFSNFKFDSEYVAISGIEKSTDFSNVQSSSILGEYGTTIDEEDLSNGSSNTDVSTATDDEVPGSADANTVSGDSLEDSSLSGDVPVTDLPAESDDGSVSGDILMD